MLVLVVLLMVLLHGRVLQMEVLLAEPHAAGR